MVTDLQASTRPLLIAGFLAIATIVDVLDGWLASAASGVVFRLVVGSEPFASTRHSFSSPFTSFGDEARRYWLEVREMFGRLCCEDLSTR